MLTAFSSVAFADSNNSLKKSAVVKFEDLTRAKTGFFSILQSYLPFCNFIVNKRVLPLNYMDVEFDDGIAVDLCNYICENSGLDIINMFENLPLDTKNLKTVYKLTGTDTAALRRSVYELRDKCNDSGEYILNAMLYFFGAYLSGIDKVDVYTKPYGSSGTSRVYVLISYIDGESEELGLDIFFSKDGLAYGNNQKGILGLGYECSVYDLLVYATVNSWMRDFGFCLLYDIFCYSTPFFNYITRRFKFDYDGKEWMVQAWKGNYLITNGAEVGIYSREKGSCGTYYNAYDGLMDMSLRLSADGTEIFSVSDSHWWINGFKFGKTLYAPVDMTAEFSIDFQNADMAKAFEKAVNENYMGDTFCTVNGSVASVIW